MRDNVLCLKVVLPNGGLMTTGQRARKSSAGYDLTRLFIGSEGTLGIITEITRKLHGIPEAISSGVCPFPSIDAACQADIATIQSGIPIARIELLDEVQVRACNAYSKLNLSEAPALFLEFHGSETGVAEQSERFGDIAREYGGTSFEWATEAEDRTRLWQARHDALPASRSFRAGARLVVRRHSRKPPMLVCSSTCAPGCYIKADNPTPSSGWGFQSGEPLEFGNGRSVVLLIGDDADEVLIWIR
jgi:D-lactate dehydrogenase (cytochrome)